MEQLKSTVAICIIATVPLWRRVWDSNPRGREPKRFSRPPRYDHFDNSPNIQFGLVKRAHLKCALFMAQKEGFEPSRAFDTPTPLAGEPLRPLGYFCTLPLKYNSIARQLCQEIYSFLFFNIDRRICRCKTQPSGHIFASDNCALICRQAAYLSRKYAITIVPRMMRYQPKTLKSFFFI